MTRSAFPSVRRSVSNFRCNYAAARRRAMGPRSWVAAGIPEADVYWQAGSRFQRRSGAIQPQGIRPHFQSGARRGGRQFWRSLSWTTSRLATDDTRLDHDAVDSHHDPIVLSGHDLFGKPVSTP